MLKFAIIGAGAGGQSMAAILTSKGYIAKLYDIDKEKIHRLQELKTIKVTGVIACEAAPAVITDRIDEVMDDVDVIMVVSTTDAHRSIAYACKPYLKDGQIVMLNPGHCGGALEIANILRGEDGCGKDLIIAEAGDLMYGCRSYEVGNILHTGLKVHVPVATLPASDIDRLMKVLGPIFPCLQPAANVLETSLNNSNPISHGPLALFNITRMENGEDFLLFGTGVTPRVARFMEKIDRERVAVVRACGVSAPTELEMLNSFWPEPQESLYNVLHNTPAYSVTKGPRTLDHRYLTEDLPYGLVPYVRLGRKLGVETPCLEALIGMFGLYMDQDYFQQGPEVEQLDLSRYR